MISSIKKDSILAIIPARGGSRGIPKKNIQSFNGKPLIAWTLQAAAQVKKIDRCIVSTDDDEIASIAKFWGADVPFLRPKELAADETSGMAPVFHALEQIDGYEHVMLLQPTSPLRSTADIEGALKTYFENSCKSCVSVNLAEPSPYNAFTLNNSLKLHALFKDFKNLRRQDLPAYYNLNGAIYIADINWLSSNQSFIGEDSCAFIMPRERSIDIDSWYDFKVAEYLMREYGSSKI